MNAGRGRGNSVFVYAKKEEKESLATGACATQNNGCSDPFLRGDCDW